MFFETSRRPISRPLCSLLRAFEMQYHLHGFMDRAVNAKNHEKWFFYQRFGWDRLPGIPNFAQDLPWIESEPESTFSWLTISAQLKDGFGPSQS